MTGLPEFFKQTCDKPYDRHSYKLVGINGNELIFDSWEEAQLYWFQAPSRFCLLYTSPSPRDRTRSRMPSSA